MPATKYAFRCENSDCPITFFYSALTKPSCPVCHSGEKVVKLAVIHITEANTPEGNPIALCGKKPASYATSQPKQATCYICLKLCENRLDEDNEPVIVLGPDIDDPIE